MPSSTSLLSYYSYYQLSKFLIGPSSYYPANGSTMTPPPTPSRSAANGITQQPSTPYHQQQAMPPQNYYVQQPYQQYTQFVPLNYAQGMPQQVK